MGYIKYVKKKMKAEHFDRFLEEIYMSAGVTTHRSCPDIMEKGSARESEELGHLLSHYNESVWRQYLKNNAPRDPRTDEPVSYDPAMVLHSSVPPGAVRVNDPLQKKHHEDIMKCHKELTTSVRKMESVTKHRVLNNNLSLYIPRVTPEWADFDRMTAKFLELKVGKVRRIDFVEKTSANGYQYYQAFVHFETWNDCQKTRHMQERIADPNRQCRLVYDDPWYW